MRLSNNVGCMNVITIRATARNAVRSGDGCVTVQLARKVFNIRSTVRSEFIYIYIREEFFFKLIFQREGLLAEEIIFYFSR